MSAIIRRMRYPGSILPDTHLLPSVSCDRGHVPGLSKAFFACQQTSQRFPLADVRSFSSTAVIPWRRSIVF